MTVQEHSVVVNDDNGRDFSILVTSIVQILLDPYYRTRVGLQALIQKDWVMGGHPFSKRSKNVFNSTKKEDKGYIYDGESPVFILFLDCLHQLLQQYPAKFEYTEQFLILISNCSQSSLFRTFMFDSEYDCQKICGGKNLVSVWDFISDNIQLSRYSFKNPTFEFKNLKPDSDINISSSLKYHDRFRTCNYFKLHIKLADIKLWTSYFCRWFPSTNISKGFTTSAVLQLQQRRLMDEVKYLEERISQLQQRSGISNENDFLGNNVASLQKGCKIEKKTHEEEDYESFFSLMSDFYFLKIL